MPRVPAAAVRNEVPEDLLRSSLRRGPPGVLQPPFASGLRCVVARDEGRVRPDDGPRRRPTSVEPG